ncbi:MFS transporter [Amycolatopsis albispora]|uniref:MFS transporter n=1 Tax=Amycolatopsis albispora TaxID=1804986 RepID=UPI00214F73AA|nr:MFS transporter [Amycolatopsis albispora]
MTLVADGFDAVTMSMVVPTLSREWQLPAAAFTAPLVATNIGVVVGLVIANWFCQRLPRRTVICLATAVFTLGTLATVLAEDITVLTVIRALTGLGFGVVFPAATSLAADVVPPRRRETASVVVPLGLSFGSTVAGLVGSRLLALLGWTSVFWLAGLFGLVLIAVLWWRLPEVARTIPVPAAASGPRETKPSSVRGLFSRGLGVTTTTMWVFSILVFATMYTLESWLPTFMLDYGFTPEQAPLGSAVKGFGGLIGGVVLVVGTMLFGAGRMIVAFLGLAAVCLAVAGALPVGTTVLLALVGGMGAGLIGGCVAQVGVAAQVYNGDRRTTGIGWNMGIGRLGSIAGPAACGVLLAAGHGPRTLFLLMAGLIVVGLAMASVFVRRAGTTPDATSTGAAPAGISG